MAYAPSRSMNDELNEGATDGKYKKIVKDRGGTIDPGTTKNRLDLDNLIYGLHEAPVKVRPDGKIVATPNYVPTVPPQIY